MSQSIQQLRDAAAEWRERAAAVRAGAAYCADRIRREDLAEAQSMLDWAAHLEALAVVTEREAV